MRRIAVSLLTSLAAVLLLLTPVAAYHSCRCGGSFTGSTDAQAHGGAGDPLRWRSGQRLEHAQSWPVPEYRCYENAVLNESSAAITDVVWKVANYFKPRIPAKKALCDALGVQGPARQEAGPILYGASSAARYQTQAWAPESGWLAVDKTARQFGFAPTYSAQLSGKAVHLSGSIGFAFSDSDEIGTLVLSSRVDFTNPLAYKYTYSILNDSPHVVHVSWGVVSNIAELRDFRRDFVMSSKRFVPIRSRETLIFPVASSESPKWGIGKVVIRDHSGTVLSAGIASSYGPTSGSVSDPAQSP